MADIFISYSSKDKLRAKQLAALLKKQGWSVWWDRDIPVGQSYDLVIERELNAAKCVIVLWTSNAVASEWVKNEAGVAAKKKVLLPVLLEEVQVPLAFRHLECALLINWEEESDHPELDILYKSISSITNTNVNLTVKKDIKSLPLNQLLLTALGVLISFFALLFYLKIIEGTDLSDFEQKRLLLLVMLAIGLGLMVFGLISAYESWKGIRKFKNLKLISAIASMAMAVIFAFVLPVPNVVLISGRVVTAAESPIRDAQVSIDGTPFYAKTLTNGLYELRLENYAVGDKVNVIVTHDEFEDKELPLKITGYRIDNFQFTLNPVSPKNQNNEKDTVH